MTVSNFPFKLTKKIFSLVTVDLSSHLQADGRSSSFKKARDTIVSGGSATSVPDALASCKFFALSLLWMFYNRYYISVDDLHKMFQQFSVGMGMGVN